MPDMEDTKHAEPQSLPVLRLSTPTLSPQLARKVVAEIIGTYLLVFVTCGAAALSAADEQRVSRLGASVAGGLIVVVMIYAVGHISGAHFNPAVTFAFASIGRFPWRLVPFYASAQFTGAISASFTLRGLFESIKHVGTTSPSESNVQALAMEIVVTFTLMFVTAAVATDNKAIGELAGIAVGSAVCISSILAGPISGGSMNPGRSIGPALASGYYKGIWVYFVGPFTGAVLGAWSYNIIRDADKPVNGISHQQRLSFEQPSMEESPDSKDMTAAFNNANHVNSTCPC